MWARPDAQAQPERASGRAACGAAAAPAPQDALAVLAQLRRRLRQLAPGLAIALPPLPPPLPESRGVSAATAAAGAWEFAAQASAVPAASTQPPPRLVSREGVQAALAQLRQHQRRASQLQVGQTAAKPVLRRARAAAGFLWSEQALSDAVCPMGLFRRQCRAQCRAQRRRADRRECGLAQQAHHQRSGWSWALAALMRRSRLSGSRQPRPAAAWLMWRRSCSGCACCRARVPRWRNSHPAELLCLAGTRNRSVMLQGTNGACSGGMFSTCHRDQHHVDKR